MARQERELHRAKVDQQKAEQAANKRKLLLQRDRLLRDNPAPATCDPDEGESRVEYCALCLLDTFTCACKSASPASHIWLPYPDCQSVLTLYSMNGSCLLDTCLAMALAAVVH